VRVRRWQRVQWQYAAEANGFDTSNRTAPHRLRSRRDGSR